MPKTIKAPDPHKKFKKGLLFEEKTIEDRMLNLFVIENGITVRLAALPCPDCEHNVTDDINAAMVHMQPGAEWVGPCNARRVRYVDEKFKKLPEIPTAYVYCPLCGLRGPLRLTTRSAIRGWNKEVWGDCRVYDPI